MSSEKIDPRQNFRKKSQEKMTTQKSTGLFGKILPNSWYGFSSPDASENVIDESITPEIINEFITKDKLEKGTWRWLIFVLAFAQGLFMWSNYVKTPVDKTDGSPACASSTNSWVIMQWVILGILVLTFLYWQIAWKNKLALSVKGIPVWGPYGFA